MPIDLTPYAPSLYLVSNLCNFSFDLDITLTLNERINGVTYFPQVQLVERIYFSLNHTLFEFESSFELVRAGLH